MNKPLNLKAKEFEEQLVKLINDVKIAIPIINRKNKPIYFK